MSTVAARIEPAGPDPREQHLLSQLVGTAGTYLDSQQMAEVNRAYLLSREAHAEQTRRSGEPYVCHPLSVALILAEMRLDHKALIAGLLHDVIEDTCYTKEQLHADFCQEVAELVDGVTKLARLDAKSKAEERAENVRKMFMATAKDLRVILIKLADRLHNMRTMESMPPQSRRRIATETLEIYAPIANRLGMSQVCRELEDLSFRTIYPLRYGVLRREVTRAQLEHREVIGTIQTTVRKRCEELGLPCKISGREKHLYSVYRKLRARRLAIREFRDIRCAVDFYGVRIVTDTVDSCYRALGVVHSLYQPIPGRFKDYIALPKENGYQSLHTLVFGPHGTPVEVQIRTREMHQLAEKGVAAHWLYKTQDAQADFSQLKAYEWVRDLLELHKQAGDSLEFVDNLKISLFPQEIFVFTPRGKIIKLPRGATALDFAYAVHTDIGNGCLSARVDSQMAPLHTVLESGQTVEIVTGPLIRPKLSWLNYAVTAKARSAIRQYYRNLTQQDAIALGQRLLEREVQALGKKWVELSPERIAELLSVLGIDNEERLYEEIGFGNRNPFLIAKRLCQEDVRAAVKLEAHESASTANPLIIKGTEGMVVTLAKCCHPIPGDDIVGFFHAGRGIVVHVGDCYNALEILKRKGHWLAVEWDPSASGEFAVEIKVELADRPGALAMLASTISGCGCNIETVTVNKPDEHSAVDFVTLTVKDRVHLAHLMRRLRRLEVVNKLARVKSG